MEKKEKIALDMAYHPERLPPDTKLLPAKPEDEFMFAEGVTLVSAENIKKLSEWEKEKHGKR